MARTLLRAVAFALPVALALVGFRLMGTGERAVSPPQREPALAVRIETVTPRQYRPRATGFGRAQAARTFSAIAEVAGRITVLQVPLGVGSTIAAGETILAIDEAPYRIAAARAAASVASAEAELRELSQTDANTRALLTIEERILASLRKEFDRTDRLVTRGTSAPAALDAAEQKLLQQERQVRTLRNTLDLVDEQRDVIEATIEVQRSELEAAERDLAATAVIAPFSGRVTSRTAEIGEYVRAGDELLTMEALGAVEVVAEFDTAALAELEAAVRPGNGDSNTAAGTPHEPLLGGGFEAVVRMAIPGSPEWPATVLRVRGSVDQEIGTVGVIVGVAKPRGSGTGPALRTGSVVEVDLVAPQSAARILVTRTAVRRDDEGVPFVFLADADDRLARRQVDVGPIIGEHVVIRAGLSAGDRVILSEPEPPIIGQRLLVVADAARGAST